MKIFNYEFIKNKFYEYLSENCDVRDQYPDDKNIEEQIEKFEEEFMKSVIQSNTVIKMFENHSKKLIKKVNTIEPCPICGNKNIKWLDDIDYVSMVSEIPVEELENDTYEGGHLMCSVHEGGCGAVSGWKKNKKDLKWKRSQK